jgi:hypothetical protein
MLAVPFQVVLLNVFARSLVEVVFQVQEFVCDGTRQRPHRVSQTNWGPLIRSTVWYKPPYQLESRNLAWPEIQWVDLQVHRRQITILMYHWHRGVYLFEINLVQLINRVLRWQGLIEAQSDHLPCKRRVHRHPPHIQVRVKSEFLHAWLRRVAGVVPALMIPVVYNSNIWVVDAEICVCCSKHGPGARMGVRGGKGWAC